MGWSAAHPGVASGHHHLTERKGGTKPDPKTTAFGIDIGKKVFHVVALNAAGAVFQRAKCSRDTLMNLSGKCGEHQLRNQEVFYGKREQTDAGVSA